MATGTCQEAFWIIYHNVFKSRLCVSLDVDVGKLTDHYRSYSTRAVWVYLKLCLDSFWFFKSCRKQDKHIQIQTYTNTTLVCWNSSLRSVCVVLSRTFWFPISFNKEESQMAFIKQFLIHYNKQSGCLNLLMSWFLFYLRPALF